MLDAAQIALILIISLLTTMILVLGIQVFLILKEFKKTLEKANKVLDNTNDITESVSTPISALSTILMGIKTGASFANMLTPKKNSEGEEKTYEQ